MKTLDLKENNPRESSRTFAERMIALSKRRNALWDEGEREEPALPPGQEIGAKQPRRVNKSAFCWKKSR
jgi:hypothetical protein